MTISAPAARVFNIQRFSVHDGPGIRTTVFLSGCALRCAWCHNPEAFADPHAGRLLHPSAVLEEVLADRAFYAQGGGGLTVSGGEPLLHPAWVRELLVLARGEGIHTCVQTSGAVPRAALEAVLDVTDLFQFDLKHVDSETHRRLTGAGTEGIHRNAAFLVEQCAHVQFRMPVLPGLNDDEPHVDRVADFLDSLGARSFRLVPYQRSYLAKYQQLGIEARCAELQPPSSIRLAHLATRMKRRGLAVGVDGA